MSIARLALLAVIGCALGGDQPRLGRDAVAAPVASGAVTLDEALRHRRSTRAFSSRAVGPGLALRLCWAAQGITEPREGLRTAPSAGALYPLELYVVGRDGVSRYEPRRDALVRFGGGDRRDALARAALGQDAVRRAGVDLVLTGVVARTRAKYGARAERYVALEAGHAAQNVLLEVTALGLGAVPIGAFDDADVRRVLGAPAGETPLYVIAVGHVD
jgi:SagB-type dehydrogenase family enzyme